MAWTSPAGCAASRGARETLLIATTGWDRDEDRSAAMVAGFDHFLPKPLNIEALISLLPPPRVPAQGTA